MKPTLQPRMNVYSLPFSIEHTSRRVSSRSLPLPWNSIWSFVSVRRGHFPGQDFVSTHKYEYPFCNLLSASPSFTNLGRYLFPCPRHICLTSSKSQARYCNLASIANTTDSTLVIAKAIGEQPSPFKIHSRPPLHVSSSRKSDNPPKD